MMPAAFPGMRILVVEDEAIVAMLIEDILEEIGCRIVGPVAGIAAALALIEADEIDGALLDVNLAGEQSYPIADALAMRGVPFTFVTGYGHAGIEPAYRENAVVQKPFTQATLRGAVDAMKNPAMRSPRA